MDLINYFLNHLELMGGVWNKDGRPASLMSMGMAVFAVLTFQCFLGSAVGTGGTKQSNAAWQSFQCESLDHCLHKEPQTPDFSNNHMPFWLGLLLAFVKPAVMIVLLLHFALSSPSPLQAAAWFFSSWSAWLSCVAMTMAFGHGVWILAHF